MKISHFKTLVVFSLAWIAAQATAKNWVLVPASTSSLGTVQAFSLSPTGSTQGLDITASINELDAHLVAGGDTAPQAPAGYAVQETVPVSIFDLIPNDPDYSQQWNLDRIDAPAAWDISQGNGTLVAIIDTGIDPSHPDLAGKVVDGQNFVGGSSYVDDHSHGTFCASLVGAGMNDGIGMAGLSPNVQLLAVKVLDSTGTGTDFGVAQGIVWAVDRGAKVINLSLGTPTASQVLADAVAYAISHNVLVVAAAGNSGTEQMFYPASYPGVMSVGACTNDDERASYSSYNSALSIMAPGGDGSSDPDEEIIGASLHGAYAFGSGTSFSSPQVAAAAALYLGIHPGANAATVFAAITSTADPIETASGWTETSGWGRLNVGRLVGAQVGPNVFEAGSLPASVLAGGGPVTFSVGAGVPDASSFNPNPSPVQYVWAIVMDDDGDEIYRQLLNQVGPRSYSADAVLPAWQGSPARDLTVSYIAQDSSGDVSDELALSGLTQLAYISSLNLSFTHIPPVSAKPGQALTLEVAQYPVLPACTDWTLYYKNASGSWASLAGTADGSGAVFSVPAGVMLAGNFDYYFSATDANGKVLDIHSQSTPWVLALKGDRGLSHMSALINPAPEICVRVISSQNDDLHMKVYDISGGLVDQYSEPIREGENRICLPQTLASGIYFAVTSLTAQNITTDIKIAIKR